MKTAGELLARSRGKGGFEKLSKHKSSGMNWVKTALHFRSTANRKHRDTIQQASQAVLV